MRRAKTVKVQAYNLEGEVIEIVTTTLPQEIAELSSRVLQHEIDHLHGVLFIDKMGPLGKLSAAARCSEFEREFRKAQEKGEIPVRRRDREAVAGAGGRQRVTPIMRPNADHGWRIAAIDPC